MYNYIKDCLVEMHSTCSTDQYGQVSKHDFQPHLLFKERADEVIQYAKENPQILRLDCYGYRYGTYYAFNIICPILQQYANQALKKNPNRLENINRW